ncbi:MAG: hypothetical protein AAFS12_12705 [Cyanobacteria bacterium J06632_19]
MTTTKSTKKPFVFYFFWAVFIALVAGIIFMAWNNIIPYHNATKAWFGLGEQPLFPVFKVLWWRVEISLSWMVAAIFWAILQGFQIAYLLFTQSERALDYIIQRDKSSAKYAVTEKDSNIVKGAKNKRNNLPLSSLLYLQFACISAYVIETIINYESYPVFGKSFFEILTKMITLNFDLKQFAMLAVTIFAIEGLVFAAIVTYRVIEVFKNSGAYKK